VHQLALCWSLSTIAYLIALISGKLTCLSNHIIDVTLTELSAEPVMHIGSVGCQSTLVIDEL
jgi:hypothetical protein